MLTDYTTEPVVMMGFEPTKHNASDLESLPFDRSGTLPVYSYERYFFFRITYGNHSLPTVGLEPTTTRLKVLRSTN